MEFRKSFNAVPRNNLWNRLEDLKVHFELRASTIRMYETLIDKFKTTCEWPRYINCNIGVNIGFPLSPTIFDIYIDKMKDCLEEAGWVGTTLTGMVIILLLYAKDVIM